MNILPKICKFILVSLFVLLFSSCTVEKLFPSVVANGVARLSVNNFGNLLRALYDDAIYESPTVDHHSECDFRSFGRTDGTSVLRDASGRGSVVRAFNNCTFDFGKSGTTVHIENLCGLEKTTFFGKVKISGTRTISGLLTENDQMMVIPSGQQGIHFEFKEVVFENYRVESDGLDKAMTILSGSASFDINVHLAQSEKLGICKIPLPNLTITNIRYSNGKGFAETIVSLPGPLGEFQAAIDGSNFQAQVGIHETSANSLHGTLKIWGQQVQIPTDEPLLNPDFTKKAYEESLACTPDLQFPIPDTCRSEVELASNLARLTTNNLGRLLFAVNEFSETHPDANCRLDQLHSTPGAWIDENSRNEKGEGMVVWDFQNCEYDFGALGQDIRGFTYKGKVKISGQRRVFGFLTGDKNIPVVPGESGVRFEISEAIFENYHVKAPDFDESLLMTSGRVAFDITIHLLKTRSKEGGPKVYQTPETNVTFNQIEILGESLFEISIPKGELQGNFKFPVHAGSLKAQAGNFQGEENTLEGSLKFFDTLVEIPKGTALVPHLLTVSPSPFSRAKDEKPFSEVEDMAADGIARLTVANLGNLMLAITDKNRPDQSEACNFRAFAKAENMHISEADGNYRTITWNFDSCVHDFGEAGLTIGEKTFYGKVTLKGQRSVRGFWTEDDRMMVIPGSSGIEFRFEAVTFTNFLVKTTEFKESMKMISGLASYDVKVHLARDIGTNLCIEPIQNLSMTNIVHNNTTVELQGEFAGGLVTAFQTKISSSKFDAQYGYGETEAQDNGLSGHVHIFGRDIQIPTDGLGLNPMPNHKEEFEKNLKEQTSLATTNRAELFVCETFEEVEASSIARLFVLNVGSIAQESFDEWLKPKEVGWSELAWYQKLNFPAKALSKCGFNSNWSKIWTQNPLSQSITGSPGSQGSVTLGINDCEVINQPIRGEYPADCIGSKTVFEGQVHVTGTKKVQGIRKPLYEPIFKKTGYEFLSSITPNHPQSITMHLSEIRTNHFCSYFVDDEMPIPKAKLTLLSGVFSADLSPVLAAKKGAPCEFYRSTPVVGFSIDVSNEMNVQLDFHVKDFDLRRTVKVNSANLKAQNGFYQGIGNFLDGEISVNDKKFVFQDIKLNPDYDQVKFDKSYDCREEFPLENEFSIEKIVDARPHTLPICE